MGGGGILSPHGALRAYTVFPTAEPRRGSSRVLSSLVTFFDVLNDVTSSVSAQTAPPRGASGER